MGANIEQTTEGAAGTDQPLNVWVQAELERMIVQGKLPPGERLNENVLASQLGVSRGPIREATRALERMGLVTTIMNRGAFVRTLTLVEISELYDLAALVSGFAAGRVAQLSNPQHGVALSDLVRRMEALDGEAEADRWFELNLTFHKAIFEYGGNDAVKKVYEDCMRRLQWLRRRTFERPRNIAQANDEHRGILLAILAGDAELARDRSEAQVRAGRARYFSTIKPELAA